MNRHLFPVLGAGLQRVSLAKGAGFATRVQTTAMLFASIGRREELKANRRRKLTTTAISWHKCCLLVAELADKIRTRGGHHDIIVAVARGGLVPARLLSYHLEILKVTSIGILPSKDDSHAYDLYSFPELSPNLNRILLVEDILESGGTLNHAEEVLRQAGYQVTTASLYYHSDSKVEPDISLGANDQKILFPWER